MADRRLTTLRPSHPAAGRRRPIPPAISHPDYQLLRTVGRVAAAETTLQLYLDAEDAGHPPSATKTRLEENLRHLLIALAFLRPLTVEGLQAKRVVAMAYADDGQEGERLFRSFEVDVRTSDTAMWDAVDSWRAAA